MDLLTFLSIIIPIVITGCVSIMHAYARILEAKSKEKDEIWETVTKIMCSHPDINNDIPADGFAILYEQLKVFKENDCSLGDECHLPTLVNKKKGRS